MILSLGHVSSPRLVELLSHLSDFWVALLRGTTHRQGDEVSRFYNEIRKLLADALRTHLRTRVGEFAEAIRKNAESVGPRIRDASENIIQQRLEAIESSLQVAAKGQKEAVASYLRQMVALLHNFAANPEALPSKLWFENIQLGELHENKSQQDSKGISKLLQEQHYEIQENETGYTYERIFRPYLDDATYITIEDPYIRLPYQVENFSRFCALAIQFAKVKKIELISGKQDNDDTSDADSRLATLLRDLAGRGVELTWRRESSLHDREIRFDNGWIVKIGRGLDIYHKPENWVSMEAAEFRLRRCRKTKVDIFKQSSRKTFA